jgi:periplasmic copper chaperone A
MIRLLRAAFAAILLLVTPAFAHNGAVHLGELNITAPFTRATLPNAPVGGGFLTIENTGAEADRLISATSSVAGDTQIHEMSMEGDVMKMRELTDGLEIPAGQTVTLAPGGYHVMFMGLNQAFVEGETVTITLVFEKAGAVDVELPVLGAAADSAGHGAMEMDHGAMETEVPMMDHGAMNPEGTK